MTSQKHIHIIGICGVATSAIAIAFQKAGWKVSGSDKGFFPPVSTELEKHNINFYAGWHPENIGKPDVVMIGGGGTSPNNPEVIYANENKIPIYPFAEILEKYFIKSNSIVTVGTWGKTTISSLLSYVLIQANFNPSYFTGGLSLSHDTGALSDSDWSIVEGDEYQVSISDKRPKFVFYHPTHLLLTSVAWDHADLYPTEDSYFQTFSDLVSKSTIKKIVACIDNVGVKKVLNNKTVITYGKDDTADYKYHSISHTRNGISFTVDNNGKSYNIKSPMIGRFNVENITGCFTMAIEIGISPEIIINSIADFKGIKRRFEKRYEDSSKTVFDCHAPTADKVASVLESLREIYSEKITAIFEPNIGGRQRSSAHLYKDVFKNVDTVVIPRLTKLKIGEGELPMDGHELSEEIKKSHSDVRFIEDDIDLVKQAILSGDIIVFLGSHGFRGMIEETIKALTISPRQQSQ